MRALATLGVGLLLLAACAEKPADAGEADEHILDFDSATVRLA
ncbi:MAG: hypothetical protein JWN53_1786, partial [Gemmatimonadetes bacterium]|nr:hypothetical protein [Gemmatimonadota bacterium]